MWRPEIEQNSSFMRSVIVALVSYDTRHLSTRQLAVLLMCYRDGAECTVRGLSAHLQIAKSAVSRALDHLSELDLVRRKEDPCDGRSVLVERTMTGAAFMRDLQSMMTDAMDRLAVPASCPVEGPVRGATALAR